MAVASLSDGFRSVNWTKVKDIMDKLGYAFTKSAMEQRWSKKILKDWRARIGTDENTEESPSTSTPSAKKRGRAKAEAGAGDGDDAGTPSKKPKGKTAVVKASKKEEVKDDCQDNHDDKPVN
ncbi:hypothetical protein ACHAQH_009094 [Verticillium albo-atrum]